MDPVALSLLSEVRIFALHLLNHHDGQVICGVAQDVQMGCYWFLEFLVVDVTVMSVEADVERVLCLSHVLQL